MRIKNIKINNYGNLGDKEIDLEDKINIIYGKNESGKSTLLNYIKNIFYGISKNKNGKSISDYEKYKPWGKEDFSGKLKYELDNGEEFEIFRDFNKKNPKIFNKDLEEISKTFSIVKKDGVQFFLDQTNVDETMFTSTVLAMQEEVKLDKQDQSVLVQKLANLAGTGDDNLSYKRIVDRLNKMQIEEVGSDRSQGRPINIVKEKMRNAEFVLKELQEYQKDKKMNEKMIEETQVKNGNLKQEIELLKQINIIKSRQQNEQEKINIKNNYKNEKNKKIEEINSEKNKLNKKINENNYEKNNLINNKSEKNKKINLKKYILILFFILIINFLIYFLNKNYIKNNIINIFNCLIIPIYLIFIFILEKNKNKNKKIKNKISVENEKLQEEINSENEKINNEINLLNKQIELLLEEKNNIEKEIEEENARLDNNIEIELEKVKQEFKDKLDVNKYLNELENNNINQLISQKQEELNKNNLDLQAIKIKEENISSKLEDLISLQEEYEQLEEEYQNLQEKNESINLAKKILEKAYINMRNDITPKFTENLSRNIEKISNGKYTKVKTNDEKGLIVENEYGEYIPAEYLSVGTIDQLYLSLRLSMIDELSNEKMPIILDEAFAYYDEDRLENILQFLNENLNEHQVIIFTCTKREQDILNKMGVKYNLVQL